VELVTHRARVVGRSIVIEDATRPAKKYSSVPAYDISDPKFHTATALRLQDFT
jgi:hypothetical protein